MSVDVNTDADQHLVLVNHEDQYSIWIADKAIPEGWRAVDGPGTRADCLQFIEKVWTDMRPLSLRRTMQSEDAMR